MSTALVGKRTMQVGDRRSPMRLWRLYVASFFIVWILLVAGFGYWPAAKAQWPISLVMVLGSLVAGSTPLGGGAIAFPFLVLALGQSPSSGRDFALAIQALGMTSAMIFIFCRRVHIESRILKWGAVGALLGIAVGNFLIAPYVAQTFVKLLFSCLWMSFAILTLAKNREICSLEGMRPVDGALARKAGLAAGIIGGILVSMIGVGVEMALYMVLVLRYRSDLKVAIPTAVSGAAIASLAGTALHVALGDIRQEVFFNWLAAGPVVVFGAPLGAYVATLVSRARILYFVSALCVFQFFWTLKHVSPAASGWLFIAAAMLAANGVFYLLYRRGKVESISRVAAMEASF